MGKNNSGKTSVLEALFLLFGMSNPALSHNMNQLRGLASTPEQLKYLFHNVNLAEKPSFHARFSDASERWLEMEPRFKQGEFAAIMSSISTPALVGVELHFAVQSSQGQRASYSSALLYGENSNTPSSTLAETYLESLSATYISSSGKEGAALSRYSEILKKKGGRLS